MTGDIGGSSSGRVSTCGADEMWVVTVALSRRQGESGAEDNKEWDLSLKVVPHVLGLNVVGQHHSKLNNSQFENLML